MSPIEFRCNNYTSVDKSVTLYIFGYSILAECGSEMPIHL
jgi:hypothetical protein